jgi:hypothetical protein
MDLDRLGGLELADPSGRPFVLGDFWSERPVIVVFLRHFG